MEHVCRQTTMKIVSEKKFKAGSEEAYLKVTNRPSRDVRRW